MVKFEGLAVHNTIGRNVSCHDMAYIRAVIPAQNMQLYQYRPTSITHKHVQFWNRRWTHNTSVYSILYSSETMASTVPYLPNKIQPWLLYARELSYQGFHFLGISWLTSLKIRYNWFYFKGYITINSPQGCRRYAIAKKNRWSSNMNPVR